MSRVENKQSKNYRALLEDGPQPASELPTSSTISPKDRQAGANRFDPKSNNAQGNAATSGGQTKVVYFIEGVHDPEEIIDVWCEVNERAVERLPSQSLHQRISEYGEGWKAASRERFEFHTEGGGENNGPDGGECPLCGATYSGALPDHLPCGNEGGAQS